jgi:hypothetical protein
VLEHKWIQKPPEVITLWQAVPVPSGTQPSNIVCRWALAADRLQMRGREEQPTTGTWGVQEETVIKSAPWWGCWAGIHTLIIIKKDKGLKSPQTIVGYFTLKLYSWKSQKIILSFTAGLNRAIVQAVSRWLPTAAAQVRSYGIYGEQSGAGAGFLRGLRFPLPIFIPPIAPQLASSIIKGWYNGPVMVTILSRLSLTPLIIKKK